MERFLRYFSLRSSVKIRLASDSIAKQRQKRLPLAISTVRTSPAHG